MHLQKQLMRALMGGSRDAVWHVEIWRITTRLKKKTIKGPNLLAALGVVEHGDDLSAADGICTRHRTSPLLRVS